DLLQKQLIDPASAKDLMGYCQPIWISDYVYQKIFNEIKTVNGASIVYAPEELDRVYERARVEPDGQLTWLDPVKMHTPPMGATRELLVKDATGTTKIAAHYYNYDHIDGGVLVWPVANGPIQSIALELGGRTMTLTR